MNEPFLYHPSYLSLPLYKYQVLVVSESSTGLGTKGILGMYMLDRWMVVWMDGWTDE